MNIQWKDFTPMKSATVSLATSGRNPPHREDKYFQGLIEVSGDDLRRVRRDLQLSQEDLGRRLGMTRNPVAEWEANKRPVPRYIELAIAEIKRQES